MIVSEFVHDGQVVHVHAESENIDGQASVLIMARWADGRPVNGYRYTIKQEPWMVMDLERALATQKGKILVRSCITDVRHRLWEQYCKAMKELERET